MSESSEVIGGETSASAAVAPNVSAASTPAEKGGAHLGFETLVEVFVFRGRYFVTGACGD